MKAKGVNTKDFDKFVGDDLNAKNITFKEGNLSFIQFCNMHDQIFKQIKDFKGVSDLYKALNTICNKMDNAALTLFKESNNDVEINKILLFDENGLFIKIAQEKINTLSEIKGFIKDYLKENSHIDDINAIKVMNIIPNVFDKKSGIMQAYSNIITNAYENTDKND